MQLDRKALEHLDREALITLVLTQQARIAALEAQVAALTARVNELSSEPPVPPPPVPPFVKPVRSQRPPKRPGLRPFRRLSPAAPYCHTLNGYLHQGLFKVGPRTSPPTINPGRPPPRTGYRAGDLPAR